jgi:hypothetical protein
MAFMRQLGCGQDYSVKGKVGDIDYIAVMDGHGNGIHRNKCIDLLRSYDFDEIAAAHDPVELIRSKLEPHDLIGSGSTFTFARVYKSKREIEVINVGDSKTVVMINGNIVYTTPEHTFHNKSELDRLQGHVIVREQTAPFPINDTTVQMIRSDIGIFPNGEILVPTQSFGHNNITGLSPSVERIPYGDNENSSIRIICGSDGFWDMCMEQYNSLAYNDPNELMKIAEDRWRQKWDYYDGKRPTVKTSYGDDFDDIAIAVLDLFV